MKKPVNKQPIIDQILVETPEPAQILEFLKRGIILRNGPDVMKNWVWNMERLPHYDYSALEEILKDAKQEADLN